MIESNSVCYSGEMSTAKCLACVEALDTEIRLLCWNIFGDSKSYELVQNWVRVGFLFLVVFAFESEIVYTL